MKKIINIDGKDYTMKSSAFTQFAYKNLTGRSFLNDIQLIIDNVDKIKEDLSKLDLIIEPILDMSYVMIKEADETQVKTKEEFIKSIENLFKDVTWMTEVEEVAIAPLSGQLQENKDNTNEQ